MASMDKAQPLDETTDPKSSPGITSNIRSTNLWVVYPVDGFPTDGTHPLQQLLESFGSQSFDDYWDNVLDAASYAVGSEDARRKFNGGNSMTVSLRFTYFVISVSPQISCRIFD
ncbi:hypothetical protein BCON_0012g00200 [Botryotinia convoluta]|uniref:Uncharacterized protein n=1 Tax=Botryotinia convoluta TaxID=54673 RepID=A0A4Z1IVW4_9HELO|nr:hypothetical protein BCON_0012g00200 [Botryotinia convoluta]